MLEGDIIPASAHAANAPEPRPAVSLLERGAAKFRSAIKALGSKEKTIQAEVRCAKCSCQIAAVDPEAITRHVEFECSALTTAALPFLTGSALKCFCGRPVSKSVFAKTVMCELCRSPVCPEHKERHWLFDSVAATRTSRPTVSGVGETSSETKSVCPGCFDALNARARSTRLRQRLARADRLVAALESSQSSGLRPKGGVLPAWQLAAPLVDGALAKAGRIVDATAHIARYVPFLDMTVSMHAKRRFVSATRSFKASGFARYRRVKPREGLWRLRDHGPDSQQGIDRGGYDTSPAGETDGWDN